MKKTLVAPLLSVALTLFLVGCGALASEPATDTTDEAESVTATDDEQAAEEESELEPESEEQEELIDLIESRGSENSDDEFELVDDDEPYERSVIDGDTYRSEFFGLAYTLPEKSDGSVVYQRHAFLKRDFHYCFIYMSSIDEAHLDEMAAGLSSLS